MKPLKLAAFLLAVLMLPGLASCKSSVSGTSKANTASKSGEFIKGGVFPICKNTVKLSIAVAQDPSISDWKDNYMTKLIEKQGNFDLSFQFYPQADYMTKLNLMVTAGGSNLPDIILGQPGDTMVYSWGQSGAIVPLTKYYSDADASYNISKAIKESGTDVLSMITSPNKQIYGLPYFNQSHNNEYPDKAWIYQPYLTKLGLKAPTTPQELYNVFKAVYSGDPNGNGQKDEVCATSFSGNYNLMKFIMSSYIYAGDPDYLDVNNGKLSPAYNTGAWKEGLAYLKSLYQAGFIPAGSFTQNSTTYHNMENNATSPVFLAIEYAVNDISETLPTKNGYVGMLPLVDKSGKTTSVYAPSIANVAFMITKNCKDVPAAFRLGDLLCDQEMALTTRWGQEGVDWDYVKNAKVSYEAQYQKAGFSPLFVSYNDSKFWSSTNIQKTCWRMAGPQMRLYNVIWGEAAAANTFTPFIDNRSKGQMLYLNTQPKEYITKLIFTQDEISQISETRSTLLSYVNENAILFITGQKDLDKDWNSYVSQLKTIGLDKFVKTAQTAYDRMGKKK